MTEQGLERMEIITCSYRPDYERCRRLCASVDRFVDDGIGHVLIVPRRDLALFSALAGGRRRLLAAEDVLPRRFFQLPGSERIWLDAHGWPVRGWILQQLLKLSATRATDAELILFADSDLQFVRPFEVGQVLRNGRLRLHRIPGAMDHGRHQRWHRRAGALLGRPTEYFGSDYVGQLITWRRSLLEGLHSHIEQTHGKPWHVAVSRSLDFSEYILYGAYAEHFSVDLKGGHYFEERDLCHCCWVEEQAEELRSGRAQLAPGAVALLIQSNLGLDAGEEGRILARASAEVEAGVA